MLHRRGSRPHLSPPSAVTACRLDARRSPWSRLSSAQRACALLLRRRSRPLPGASDLNRRIQRQRFVCIHDLIDHTHDPANLVDLVPRCSMFAADSPTDFAMRASCSATHPLRSPPSRAEFTALSAEQPRRAVAWCERHETVAAISIVVAIAPHLLLLILCATRKAGTRCGALPARAY